MRIIRFITVKHVTLTLSPEHLALLVQTGTHATVAVRGPDLAWLSVLQKHIRRTVGRRASAVLRQITLSQRLPTHRPGHTQLLGKRWMGWSERVPLRECMFMCVIICTFTNLAVFTADAIRRALGPGNQFARASIAARVVTFLNTHTDRKQITEVKSALLHLFVCIVWHVRIALMIRGGNCFVISRFLIFE